MGRIGLFDGAAEAGPSVGPVPVSCCARDAHRFGNLFDGQPGEKVQLHHLGRVGVLPGESREGPIERENLIVAEILSHIGLDWHIAIFEVYALTAAAMLAALLSSRAFDEDSAHGFRGRREKMAARIPAPSQIRAYQAQVCLVTQRCRLPRVSWPLCRQPPRR